MKTTVLLGLLCFASALASADSIKNIPITGFADYGQFFYCCDNGDFRISGPSLSLIQGTSDGPDVIGKCGVGAVCNFSFVIDLRSQLPFCYYTPGCSAGSLGNNTADFLIPDLKFTGSALYSGGDTLTLPMTVEGIVIGYKLVNCSPPGVDCSLGPKVFTLKLAGQGEGTVRLTDFGDPAIASDIKGVGISFTGTATVVPEPASLILAGTGLLGLWMKKKKVSRGAARY